MRVLDKIKQSIQNKQTGGEIVIDDSIHNLPISNISHSRPQWGVYEDEFEKINPRHEYLLNTSIWANRQNLSDRWEQERDEYIYDRLLKDNPIKEGEGRGQYIDRVVGTSNRLQDIVQQHSNRNESTSQNLWTETLSGLLSYGINNPSIIQQKANIDNRYYSTQEKDERGNNPIRTYLTDMMSKPAQILSIPYNTTTGVLYTQQQGQDDYNMLSGLSGQVPNNRNTQLEIFADPLNVVGIGELSSGTRGLTKVFNKIDDIPITLATENQTLIQAERLKNPQIIEKFFNQKNYNKIENGNIEGISLFRKPQNATDMSKSEYIQIIDDTHLNTTNIGTASDFNKNPQNLGSGNYGQPGNIFLDSPLSAKQKGIIEAHEKKSWGFY